MADRPRRNQAAALLAWRNLTESRLHLLTSVAGAAFAVTLMFMQNGFRHALLDSMTSVIRRFDGDLVVFHRGLYTLVVPLQFPMRRLQPAAGFDEVEAISPVYVETRKPLWRNVRDGLPRRIRVVGFRPEDQILDIPELRRNIALWKAPETVMADADAKPKYGPLTPGLTSELAGRRVRIAGLFRLGADFQNDGTLVTSEENFLAYFPERRGLTAADRAIDIGVIHLRPGADPQRVQERISVLLDQDVEVMTKREFIAKEQGFWDRVAPVGTVFNIGVVMGFIVGLAICYQVLFSDIADRMAEFATLKAVGHGERWLMGVVVLQAVFLSLLGYAVGLVVSQGLFLLIRNATGLPMEFKPLGALMILGLTVAMCVLSGLLAAQRLTRVDPAQLFR
jgi:putative ABC transport system permease protein